MNVQWRKFQSSTLLARVCGIAALILATAPALGQMAIQPSPQQIDIEPIPIPLCNPLRNGSFQDGLFGWNPTVCEGGFGDYTASAGATVQDLGTPGWDANVACLNAGASATWTCRKPSGSAGQGQITLVRKARVTARFLRFKVTGGFGFSAKANGQVKYNVQAVISTAGGAVVKCVIVDEDYQGNLPCNVAILALGTFGNTFVCCDVTGGFNNPTGISFGDDVEIEITFSVATVACNDCDHADFGGVLYVDNFQFCHYCLSPVPLPLPVPIDITPQPLPQPVPAPAQIGETSDATKRVLAVDLKQIDQYVREQLAIEAEEMLLEDSYE